MMAADRHTNPAEPSGSAPGIAVVAVNRIERVITVFCRYVVLLTGIALTLILTANVFARYAFSAGGLDVAQELPERLFPWFIVAGIVLAAQAGGHMAVEWLIGRAGPKGGRWVILLGNAIIVVAYSILFRQALVLADIAKIERSPVLQLPGSHGYWAMAMGFGLIAVVTLCQSVRLLVAGTGSRFSLEYEEV
jgi:TRAP-type C4-dicarboxylate transport system permease small subunit